MEYYSTFVVKVWCDDHGEMVRGHIQHVNTQEAAHVLSLGRVADFIMSHLSPPLNSAVDRDGVLGESSLMSEGVGYIGKDE